MVKAEQGDDLLTGWRQFGSGPSFEFATAEEAERAAAEFERSQFWLDDENVTDRTAILTRVVDVDEIEGYKSSS